MVAQIAWARRSHGAEAAFARAFKRVIGKPPGAIRRASEVGADATDGGAPAVSAS